MINIKGDVFTNEVRDIVSDFVYAMQDVVHRHGYEADVLLSQQM